MENFEQERQPHGHSMKLNDRKVGPCDILCKINDNDYQVKLSPHLSISNVFNVQHIVPYVSYDPAATAPTWGQVFFKRGGRDVEAVW